MAASVSQLEGVTVGIFLALEGSEGVEFTEPREAVTDAGATVEVLGIEEGEAMTVNTIWGRAGATGSTARSRRSPPMSSTP